MLALTAPINNLQSTLSPGLAPGIQFALDLTDSNVGMPDREPFVLSQPGEGLSLGRLAGSPPPYSFQRQVLL